MSLPRLREEAILFAGTLSSSYEIYSKAFSVLSHVYGEISFESPFSAWDHSEYYAAEMGSPLMRNFIFFSPVIDTSSLPDAKLKAIEIERTFSEDGKRRINIDPGYVSLAKVVLSSHKNYSHRIYLGRLVFAELEMIYKKDEGFYPMPHAYIDYRDEHVIAIFNQARQRLKKVLDARGS